MPKAKWGMRLSEGSFLWAWILSLECGAFVIKHSRTLACNVITFEMRFNVVTLKGQWHSSHSSHLTLQDHTFLPLIMNVDKRMPMGCCHFLACSMIHWSFLKCSFPLDSCSFLNNLLIFSIRFCRLDVAESCTHKILTVRLPKLDLC